ncbi:MAG: butyrate kinase, partial [Spirochaetales bacterium]|nr:butyrate kinase [Spirochaetales bacterium]
YVNSRMIDDLISCRYGTHPSNLGAVLGKSAAEKYGCTAVIADPVGVDEFAAPARISGLHGIDRKSFSHALNLRSTARQIANDLSIAFDRARFVGIHLGGGISVAALNGGRIIDVNNSSEGGPFTPQRTGSLPVLQLVDLAFSGRFAVADELKEHLTKSGGLVSYLGTDNVEEVLRRIESGDRDAELVLRGMAYQIAKESGAMAAALGGAPDAVFLTGGFAVPPVSEWISEYISWIAPVIVRPGEREMLALAEAAGRFLQGEEAPLEY